MNILAVFEGLAAIPKLIDEIKQLRSRYDDMNNRKWMKISARVERKLHDAQSPDDIKQVALEIKHLIDGS